MNTPQFWSKRGIVAWLLWPVSFIYPLITFCRQWWSKPQPVDIPVICVGGLTAGGAGKTPVALYLGEHCKQRGINVWFVSRGYKGTLHGPLQVKPSSHSAREVGDEPLLLAGCLPTIMAKDRNAGVRFALRQGAEMIITDDGFQNPGLHKDVSLLVIDGSYGLGNGFTLPAGPLREWPQRAFKRADAVILMNPATQLPCALPPGKPVIPMRTVPDENAKKLAGKNVLAFCGLALPQKFFATLEQLGAQIIDSRIFADHYAYRPEEIEALAGEAKAQQAILVTTSKDAARLPARLRALVTVVHITLTCEQPEILETCLHSVIQSAHEKKSATPA